MFDLLVPESQPTVISGYLVGWEVMGSWGAPRTLTEVGGKKTSEEHKGDLSITMGNFVIRSGCFGPDL